MKNFQVLFFLLSVLPFTSFASDTDDIMGLLPKINEHCSVAIMDVDLPNHEDKYVILVSSSPFCRSPYLYIRVIPSDDDKLERITYLYEDIGADGILDSYIKNTREEPISSGIEEHKRILIMVKRHLQDRIQQQ